MAKTTTKDLKFPTAKTKKVTKKKTTKKVAKQVTKSPKKATKKKAPVAKKATKKTTAEPTKKTVKKSVKPGTKKVYPKNHKAVLATNQLERRQAKSLSINLGQYRVLRAIKSSVGKKLSYAGIKQATKQNYYYSLTCWMRASHEMSLTSKGFTREEQHDIKGRDTLMFAITPAGTKAIKEAAKVA